MNYIEVKVNFNKEQTELSEILIAFLAEQGFESFYEENYSNLTKFLIQQKLFRNKTGMLNGKKTLNPQ